MKFEKSSLGTIQNRYKRFLSDITLDSGEKIHAHVPNTGSMTTCWDKEWKVLVTKSDNTKRKLPYTLELTHNGDTWICVNTSITNKLVHEALELNKIPELTGYAVIKPEAKIYESRLDFFLSSHDTQLDTYVEVKNVTLLGKQHIALFPDSVSKRGQKHLDDLIRIKQSGLRAVMLYVVNREDVHSFAPAKSIDPVYANLLLKAKNCGVEILAYQTTINEKEIYLNNSIEIIL